MGDSDFDHFLEVLNEVEALTPKEWKERKIKTTSQKPRANGCQNNMAKCSCILEMRTIKSKTTSHRYSLRRPGFIYRKRDLSRESYLDNNLWEFTCGRRVLKAPSFKYRHKRKSSLSPYSTHILESLDKLTLDPQLEKSNINPLRFGNSQEKCASKPHKSLYEFLPLSKSSVVTSNVKEVSLSKHPKPIITPGSLSLVSPKLNHIQARDTALTEDSGKASGWIADHSAPSFATLSINSDQVPVPKSFVATSRNLSTSRQSLISKSTSSGVESPPSTESTSKPQSSIERSCSFQARLCELDTSVDELSLYMEDFLFLPQKMSTMAEMMYT